MSLRDIARSSAAGQIGRDHPWLVLFLGPLLIIALVAAGVAALFWGATRIAGSAPAVHGPDVDLSFSPWWLLLLLPLLAYGLWRFSRYIDGY